jgi:probable metal-binding protein
MDLIFAAEAGITPEDLERQVYEHFGEAARFTNCSELIFTLPQLLAFLLQRGKVTFSDGKITLNRARICDH